MLQRGALVGAYRVEAHVASGTMGDVYRVRQVVHDTVHALKFLPLAGAHARASLLREASNLARLSHPNVVTLTEVIDVDGDPGLVMEYVDGPGLVSWLAEPHTLREIEDLFTGIVRGVAHAHRAGLVHRDLKPANVLLARTPNGLVPKVGDFGLAKAIDPGEPSGGLTRTDIALGAAPYLAPEQLRDPRSVDARADVFSLGCLLYEMLFGARAFDGPDPLSVMNAVTRGEWRLPSRAAGLPERFVRALRGALEVDRDRRFPSCEALLDALHEGEHRTPVSGPRVALPARRSRWGYEERVLALLGALVVTFAAFMLLMRSNLLR